ncbi:FKBP-type peptidyl-prolyl cis-trans isomerase [Streptomyces xiaopingdaonensis]|uniref:FKBP-type peptidyl-prolyl cis-trans isomerase n=1 Tax=Streptomyces xiaopingdaonensis TaxID=1565415 RepID=UPI000382C04E|nr:FKBP-type peptidyl-prolyl cis-trans isomerase [Streptomyces xiaopingdaonensis]
MLQRSGGKSPRASRPARQTVRRSATALLALPLLLAAAACGTEDGSGDDKNSRPVVTGALEQKPKIKKAEGDPPKKLESKVLKQGKGEKVQKGDALNAHYVGQLWNGKEFDSSWKRGDPTTFEIGTGKVIKGWDEALVGQKIGSRVQIIAPPAKAYGKQGQPPTIPANSTLVFVVDLKKIMPSQIDGKPSEEEPNSELPVVSSKVEKGKAPKIEMPKGKEEGPDELVKQTVVEGDGEKVGKKKTVLAHFTAKLWKDSKQLDNTWEQGGPQEIALDQIPGWKEGLKGAKAGSRVVFSVPGSEFPKQQQKQFKSGVVFSVDILDIN